MLNNSLPCIYLTSISCCVIWDLDYYSVLFGVILYFTLYYLGKSLICHHFAGLFVKTFERISNSNNKRIVSCSCKEHYLAKNLHKYESFFGSIHFKKWVCKSLFCTKYTYVILFSISTTYIKLFFKKKRWHDGHN